jgi:hypothetical protein
MEICYYGRLGLPENFDSSKGVILFMQKEFVEKSIEKAVSKLSKEVFSSLRDCSENLKKLKDEFKKLSDKFVKLSESTKSKKLKKTRKVK